MKRLRGGFRLRPWHLATLAAALPGGCRTAAPPSPPAAAEGRPTLSTAQGRVVHSDPALDYAIIDFDVWPEPGRELRLVNADGVTAVVRVTGRRLGSCHVVEIVEGRPSVGDHVDATREATHADD